MVTDTCVSQASKKWKVPRSYSELLSKFGEISFQEHVVEGISHTVFYDDPIYKLRRVKGEANFVPSVSKIVIRLWCRKYEQVIIEMTIGLVLDPSTALYKSFLEHYTLTNKAVGTLVCDLSNPPQRRQGPDTLPDCYYRDSFNLRTWARFLAEHSKH